MCAALLPYARSTYELKPGKREPTPRGVLLNSLKVAAQRCASALPATLTPGTCLRSCRRETLTP